MSPNPPRLRKSLLTLLATTLLGLAGSAQAQLEIFAEFFQDPGRTVQTTNSFPTNLGTTPVNGIGGTGGGRFTFKPTTPAARANSFFTDVFVGSNVYKITVKGTVDTTPYAGDTGVGPVFGISGSAVAIQATLFISATANPTPVFREEGSNVGGYGHLSDFRGYNEILSIHFSMQGSNPAAGPVKKLGVLNTAFLPPASPLPPTIAIEELYSVSGSPTAKVWLSDSLDLGEPEHVAFTLREGNSYFFIGDIDDPGQIYDFYPVIYLYDGVSGKYCFGQITSVEVEEDLGALLLGRWNQQDVIAYQLQKATASLKRIRALAKKRGKKLKSYGPYKSALKKYQKAVGLENNPDFDPFE